MNFDFSIKTEPLSSIDRTPNGHVVFKKKRVRNMNFYVVFPSLKKVW